MRLFIIVLSILLCTHTIIAQHGFKPAGSLSKSAETKLHAAEDTLAIMAYALVNDSLPQARFLACQTLIKGLVKALKTENSYQYKFERLNGVSILSPPDNSFRIFTWQLFVDDSTYRYYGAIQHNTKDLLLFPLIDKSIDMEEADLNPDNVVQNERWYGALYYNIREFDTKNGRQYLVFGFDTPDFFTKRKTIDVLHFDKTGKPSLGAPVFDRDTITASPAHRLIWEYTAEASIKVNWDEQYQMILFDHLIPVPSRHSQGIIYVPDGSYDALTFEKGRWKFINKIFNDLNKELPLPEPVLETRKEKDINGKPKQRKNKKRKD